MPDPARSMRAVSLHPHMANFAAQYAASCTMPSRPPMLDTLTTSPAPRSRIRGKSAIAIRMGEKKLTSIVWFTSSSVRSSVCFRLAMAALLTRQSRPPKASQASRATVSARSRSPRSALHMRDSGECARHCSRTSSRRSARRATMPTVAPRSASCGARAAPIPDDAPVTRMVEPSIFTQEPPWRCRPPCAARRAGRRW